MDRDTELYRQVSPSFIREGRVTRQVFLLTEKDKGELSVYDGSMISPKQSYLHFTVKYGSAGVLSVTVADCLGLGLNVKSAPKEFREHAVIAFPDSFQKSKAVLKNIAIKLRDLAVGYGWKYRPFFSVTTTD